MRVSDIQVAHFAKDEYPDLHVSGIGGDNFLIHGGNRTGKTLSLNAILYNLLGSQATIDLATGRGNKVEIDYTNGISFYRGVPEAEYEDDSSYLTAADALRKFRKELCPSSHGQVPGRDVIRSHFLHSHTGRLPLLSLSDSDLLSVVRSVVDPDIHSELEYHERAKQELSAIVEKNRTTKNELENDLQDTVSQVRSAESELEKWEDILELYESGRLSEINDELATRESIRSELSELYQEKEGLRKEKRTLGKEEKRWKNYHEEEVADVIASAVEDFVCPVCGDHIEDDRAKNRLQQGYCPFCGEQKSVSELKSDIREQIELSDDRLNEIRERQDQIGDRLDELEREESELKSDLPNLDELDSFVERRLRENGYEVEGIDEKARDEIEKNTQTIDQGETKIDELEAKTEALEQRVEEIKDSIAVASDAIREVQSKAADLIEEFQDRWAENYADVADELSLDIRLTDDAEVVLPGNTDDRVLSQEGDFSDAEIRLLNIAFATTLNEFATETGITNWNTIVIDEPFTYLDDDSTESLIEYINESEQQFIVTSSSDGLESIFTETVSLTRNTIQTTFQRY
ncbi:hypothetical protein ACFQJ7_11705 [Halovenus rubra]|uniref:Uncharacterized protein n=2 Tax=Halovenus rubra TaxID=869890 RepID=A0ACC7E0V2_9EURY|nr:hypothetical protein [Halovenus rubra]